MICSNKPIYSFELASDKEGRFNRIFVLPKK